MENVIAWVSANWQTILAVWGGVVLVASAIVKATPSQRDDAILEKVLKWVDYLSIFNKKPTVTIGDPPKAP